MANPYFGNLPDFYMSIAQKTVEVKEIIVLLSIFLREQS